jgi:hypothetical protein
VEGAFRRGAKNATCQRLAAAMPTHRLSRAGQLDRYRCQCTPSAVAHRYVPVPAVPGPNQAALANTASAAPKLPVMVPTLAHASRPSALQNSSSAAPRETTAHTVRADAAIARRSPGRAILRQRAPPS